MHYLATKFKTLTPDEQRPVLDEILATFTPETKADQYELTLMADHIEAAEERFQNFGKMQGLSSGYQSVDNLTKGFVPGELAVVAGKTSKGKTTFAINVANNAALAGKRVLFVTLEMTQAEITSRFMYLNDGLTEDFYTASALVMFQKTQDLNWKSIDGLIEQAKAQMDVDLVIIDHLHYFSREVQGIAEDLGRITKEFKKNAITKNIPVLLISHVRKTQGNAEATMDDLRSSSFIAQDADIVLMVGRKQDVQDRLLVRIEKNRNRGFDAANNQVELLFNNTKLTELPSWTR